MIMVIAMIVSTLAATEAGMHSVSQACKYLVIALEPRSFRDVGITRWSESLAAEESRLRRVLISFPLSRSQSGVAHCHVLLASSVTCRVTVRSQLSSA